LRRMARGYTAERYREIVEQLRAAIPGVQIGADLIAGFCGETEEDHRATLELFQSEIAPVLRREIPSRPFPPAVGS